jgi:RNA polymerase sigma-70 factor (ECF subfamily)
MQIDQDQLIRRAVDGDQVALTMLLKDGRRRLCEGLSGRVPAELRTTIDVDDLAQQAHVIVFRRIKDFVPAGPDGFFRWVEAIALGKLRDAVKGVRAAKRGGGRVAAVVGGGDAERSVVALLDMVAAAGRSPSRSAAWHEQVAALQSAIATLPEHYRQAVTLVYIEGRTVAEAANIMGRSERSLHGLCRRAIELLRVDLLSTCIFVRSGEAGPRV